MRLLICLNEKEKRQWCLIYFICKYSEEDCSSRGELMLSSTLLFAELPDLRRSVRGSLTREVRTTEDAFAGDLHTWY